MNPLPPLPAWQARSFWLTLIAAAAALSTSFGFDLFGLFGVDSADSLADSIMTIVAAVATVWAWFERKNPARSLSLSGDNI